MTQAGVSTVSRPIEGDVLGATGEDVLYVLAHGEKEGPQEGPQNDIAQITKVQKIQQLTKNGTTPAQMIRVIATGLSIELSQTMESFCIHHVYGKERLLNIASGTSKERFRPHGMWDAVKWDGSEESSQKKPYYTYVLRNPDTNEVLYTGKGKSERCFAHFQDLDTISEEERNKKQAALQELLDKGKTFYTCH